MRFLRGFHGNKNLIWKIIIIIIIIIIMTIIKIIINTFKITVSFEDNAWQYREKNVTTWVVWRKLLKLRDYQYQWESQHVCFLLTLSCQKKKTSKYSQNWWRHQQQERRIRRRISDTVCEANPSEFYGLPFNPASIY